MSTFKKEIMEEAIQLACQNVKESDGGPFGAIVTKDGTAIATGVNSVVPNRDPTAHAEIQAIRKACESLGNHDLSGCSLYTSTEPCPMCLAAIYWARIDRVWFAASRHDAAKAGFDDACIYEEISREIPDRKLEMHHCEMERASEPFSAWNKKTNKTAY